MSLAVIVKKQTDHQNTDRNNEKKPALRKIKRGVLPPHLPTQKHHI